MRLRFRYIYTHENNLAAEDIYTEITITMCMLLIAFMQELEVLVQSPKGLFLRVCESQSVEAFSSYYWAVALSCAADVTACRR